MSKDPYLVLGIEKNSNDDDIKKAFRKLALREHPDKGGNPEKFKEIQSAYEILSDKDKKLKYDRLGHAGLDESMINNNNNTDDVFNAFFNQSFNFNFRGDVRGGGGRPSKSPPIKRNLPISLRDLYIGKTMRLSITRNVITGNSVSCVDCGGKGFKTQIRQFGPGMIQQSQTTCQKCRGVGKTCSFEKQNKIVELIIEKGMQDQATIRFNEMGDENINTIPADILFIINEQSDNTFKRKKNDLLIIKDISIYDVFVDYEFNLNLLDDSVVKIKVKANTIKPSSFKLTNGAHGFVNEPFVLSANGLGMPKQNTGGLAFGDLFVIFNIVFDDKLDLFKINSKLQKNGTGAGAGTDDAHLYESYNLKTDSISRFGI